MNERNISIIECKKGGEDLNVTEKGFARLLELGALEIGKFKEGNYVYEWHHLLTSEELREKGIGVWDLLKAVALD